MNDIETFECESFMRDAALRIDQRVLQSVFYFDILAPIHSNFLFINFFAKKIVCYLSLHISKVSWVIFMKEIFSFLTFLWKYKWRLISTKQNNFQQLLTKIHCGDWISNTQYTKVIFLAIKNQIWNINIFLWKFIKICHSRKLYAHNLQ